MRKAPTGSRQASEIIAIQALGLIAENHDWLGMFLAETGLGPASLRQASRDPAFLSGVMDFILRDDSRVTALAEAAGVDPVHIAAAHDILSGSHALRSEP